MRRKRKMTTTKIETLPDMVYGSRPAHQHTSSVSGLTWKCNSPYCEEMDIPHPSEPAACHQSFKAANPGKDAKDATIHLFHGYDRKPVGVESISRMATCVSSVASTVHPSRPINDDWQPNYYLHRF